MNDNHNPIPIRFPVLLASQYLAVVERSNMSIRDQLRPPDWAEYQSRRGSLYPRWFSWGITAALLLVLSLSFFISAGKQAAAMGLILDHLPNRFNHLSSLWANFSIVFMLLFSEIGTVLFLIVAGTLAQDAPRMKIGGSLVNITQWALRFFGVLCAAYAIVANMTITAMDTVREAVVLQWLVTAGIPVVVLGLAIILERIIVESLKSNVDAQARFGKAQREYELYHSDPTQHPSYPPVLADLLYHEMLKVRSVTMIIKTLVDTDPRYKRWLVSAEYKTQQETTRIDLNIDLATILPDPGTPILAVPARVSNGVSRGVSTPKRQRDPDAMDKALDWLGKHGKNGMSYRDLASAAGVSLATMQRAVKQFGEGKE